MTATAQAPTKRVAFGRGATPPRRTTGHYELRREGIPEEVITPDSSGETAFAAAIGLFTAAATLTPLLTGNSVEAPLAGVAGSLMGLWAVDTLALNSIIGRIALAGIQNGRKVAIHEAGHLMVAYLLGARVTGYTLTSVKGVIEGVNGGVEVECNDAWVAAAVGLGGISAELVEFGGCVGAEADLKDVGQVVKQIGAGEGVVRWALLAGYKIVKEHRDALNAVADVMMRDGDVQDCFAAIDERVNVDKLAADEK